MNTANTAARRWKVQRQRMQTNVSVAALRSAPAAPTINRSTGMPLKQAGDVEAAVSCTQRSLSVKNTVPPLWGNCCAEIKEGSRITTSK
jgi:hypothetical protein